MASDRARNVLRIEILGTAFGQKIENRLHVAFESTPTLEAASTIAAAVAGWCEDVGCNLFSDDFQYTGVKITDLTDPNSFTLYYNSSFPKPGVGTNGQMPLNVSVAVSLHTNGRGRRLLGRLFHMAVPLEGVNGNQITDAFKTSLQSAYTELLEVLTEGTGAWWPALLHLAIPEEAVPAGDNKVPTRLQNVTVEGNLDSMRRRLTGRGQ